MDIEKIARAVCRAKGIDPDQKATGLGREMPAGSEYYLWEYQAKFVQVVLDIALADDLK